MVGGEVIRRKLSDRRVRDSLSFSMLADASKWVELTNHVWARSVSLDRVEVRLPSVRDKNVVSNAYIATVTILFDLSWSVAVGTGVPLQSSLFPSTPGKLGTGEDYVGLLQAVRVWVDGGSLCVGVCSSGEGSYPDLLRAFHSWDNLSRAGTKGCTKEGRYVLLIVLRWECVDWLWFSFLLLL